MATTLNDLTKTPLELTGENGKVYKLPPLNLKTKGMLDRWFESLPFELAAAKEKAAGPNVPNSVREKIWEHVFEDADPDTERGKIFRETFLKTAEGVLKVLYFSISSNDPSVTEAEVSTILNIVSLQELQGKIDQVNQLAQSQLKK